MIDFSSLCDDFYINTSLCTEMPLPRNRETILHFFEQIRKAYPTMRNFFRRDRGDFVLEEERDIGAYRWCSIEPHRLCSGFFNPSTVEEARRQHELVLEMAPYILSLSPLDCEALDVLYGFDFTFRGNQNELIAEALGLSPGMESVARVPGGRVINFEPNLTLAMDEECRRQFRLSIETRTNAHQIRTGEFPEDQLSIYATLRQYGSFSADATFVDESRALHQACEEILRTLVIPNILDPVAKAIACN